MHCYKEVVLFALQNVKMQSIIFIIISLKKKKKD